MDWSQILSSFGSGTPQQGQVGFMPPANYSVAPQMTSGAGLIPGNAAQGMNAGAFNFGGAPTTTNGGGLNFGLNIPTAQLALGGIASLANMFMANKSLGLAKDQFNFASGMANTNLNNQIKSYNTGLEDKLRTRAEFGGQGSDSWKADYERLKAAR